MIKTNSWLLAFCLIGMLLLDMSCKDQRSTVNQGASVTKIENPQAPPASHKPETVQTKDGFRGEGYYKRLQGAISGYPVTMHLVERMEKDVMENAPGNRVYGYYFYEKYQQPIPLYQYQPDEDEEALKNKIVLYEQNISHENPQWIGEYDEGGGFTGIWRDESGKELSFYLEEAYPQGSTWLKASRFSSSHFRLGFAFVYV